ncbi:Saccharopine dehydrogenase [Roseovarius albus]|uniref:Saccharopine dehydrogenase n=1 Tax=Roseovarius albus TaxID=1247867 RepID=A0A1X6YN43_9RHOB|nr:SDR family oxidoreductase [Roseovarius albus]SLN25739.1 Saccharopine dehydrogenase [Roseovarius albus]
MKILVLGGYGVFGGRLAELLSDLPQLELLICGRNLDRATAFCNAYLGKPQVHPLSLDRAQIHNCLTTEQPDLVVDASGPFQNYGDDPYRVVKACINAGTSYLDFADAADFVFGITQFDQNAKDAGVFILSGVSSFPVLTATVLREMSKTMDITSVEGGIAPSPYAGVGLNVMRAVVGYAGAPVRLTRDSKQTTARGLAESRRHTIAVPGRLPLKNIHFSLVDVPDLQVIPPEHETLQDIWMGAGPVPEILHRILNLLAKARAALHLPALTPLSGLFYKVLNLMKFGEHRGGMYVRATGKRDDQDITQTWHLLAEGNDGPYIPSMAIEALIRKLLLGIAPAPGARPATRALELSDYDLLFEDRSIFTGFRSPLPADAPLYQHILGPAFHNLPTPVRTLHNSTAKRTWNGQAEVQRGKGMLANAIARLIGFPNTGKDIPACVTLTPQGNQELWHRDFGGKPFSSQQWAGTGRNQHLLIERFGPIRVALALVIEDDKMYLIPRHWFCFGLPLPRALLPKGQTFETTRDNQFCFNVSIEAPIVGLIVSYKGTLQPTAPIRAA